MRENHIKRMLAYSSVAQIGYIFMGIGLGSIEGLMASCFHILVHACCKPLLFLLRRQALRRQRPPQEPEEPAGQRLPGHWGGLGFTVGALSMIGIPLFGGFVSKLYFASAALPTGMTAMIAADHRPVHGAERPVLRSGAAGHLGEAAGGG